MHQPRLKVLTLVLLLNVTALFVFRATIFLKVHSQTNSGCPTTKTTSWAKGKIVYYNYGNITDPTIQSQIQAPPGMAVTKLMVHLS